MTRTDRSNGKTGYLDLSTAASDLERRTQVCVVGGGVAGQTVARRLAKAGCEVIIAESGGLDFDKQTQDLAKGDVVGMEYYDLDDSRLRMFGGTTAIWGGRSVALDRIDFEKRAWVAHSGWPISFEELDPYVDEAFTALNLSRPNGWAFFGLEPPLDEALIDSPIWAFDKKTERFTDPADLSHPKIEIVMNATLSRIAIGNADEVTALTFQSLTGRTLTVQADRYVLATGGIETPRLLLAATPDRPDGLGNGRDLVGRFFMEHPHARAGRVFPTDGSKEAEKALKRLIYNKLTMGGQRYAAAYRASEGQQERLGLLNSAISLAIRRHEGQGTPLAQRAIGFMKHRLPATRANRALYRRAKPYIGKWLPDSKAKGPWRHAPFLENKQGLYAVVRAEQAPNPDSRVRLGDERDALGMRRAVLDWQLSSLDKDSITGLMSVFGQALETANLGAVQPASWLNDETNGWTFDPLVSAHPIGGYHHIGTTRMAATSHEGVVDTNCCLFESPNLYIAGSSVFPTAGWANPTITIIALAMRLGDHLATEVAT